MARPQTDITVQLATTVRIDAKSADLKFSGVSSSELLILATMARPSDERDSLAIICVRNIDAELRSSEGLRVGDRTCL